MPLVMSDDVDHGRGERGAHVEGIVTIDEGTEFRQPCGDVWHVESLGDRRDGVHSSGIGHSVEGNHTFEHRAAH